MITLHNTLTGQVDEFTPQHPDKVTLYTCGPTVYSEPLIGNWVSYIRWDTLVRVLMANGLAVERVMNITDVGHLVSDADDGEDKMQKGAKREGITAWEVARTMRYRSKSRQALSMQRVQQPATAPPARSSCSQSVDR